MNFIEMNLSNTDQDVIDFCDSDQFERFERIMNRMYLEKLQDFHRTSPDKLEASRASMTTLLNLSTLMIGLKTTIIEQRKMKRNTEEVS